LQSYFLNINNKPVSLLNEWTKSLFQAKMHPILRASITSGSLYILGDLTNQFWIRQQEWDMDQTWKFALTGALLHGPYFLFGFRKLDRLFPTKDFKNIILKTMAGQVFLFPPFVAVYLSANALLHSKSPVDELKGRFIEINKTGLIVWPLANLFQFRYIPSDYRVLYVNLIGLGWNTYLSMASHELKKNAV